MSEHEYAVDVDALAGLLAAATPGPWEHYGDRVIWPSGRGPAANDRVAAVSDAHAECADLIVAAVNAAPALLAEVAVLRSKVEAVEALDDKLCDALVAARNGKYDGRTAGQHLESAIAYLRAALANDSTQQHP